MPRGSLDALKLVPKAPEIPEMATSIETLHPVVRPRRIGLCGGTVIETENATFAEELGGELATEEGMILLTGGFKCFAQSTDAPSGDWSFIKGARERLRRERIPIERKVETLLPDPSH